MTGTMIKKVVVSDDNHIIIKDSKIVFNMEGLSHESHEEFS